jgi:anti-anti-sigma regulatory factor
MFYMTAEPRTAGFLRRVGEPSMMLATAEPLPETMFTLSRAGEVAILSLTCPTIRERQAAVLGNYLNSLASQVGGRLVVEVSGVGSFGCAWINQLLSLTGHCRSFGGELVILGMPERDARVLRSTGLARHLVLASSRSEALSRFATGNISPWRLAVARLLDIPVAEAPIAKAA